MPINTRDESCNGSLAKLKQSTAIIFAHFEVYYNFDDLHSMNTFDQKYEQFKKKYDVYDSYQSFSYRFNLADLM